WEPAARHLNLGPAAFGDQVVWLVHDDKGQIVDRSKQSGAEDLLAEASQVLRTSQRSSKRLRWQGERWQCSQVWIQPVAPVKKGSGGSRVISGPQEPPGGGSPEMTPDPFLNDGPRYSALAITVGVS